jgi:beta-glucanase (GH16 family)
MTTTFTDSHQQSPAPQQARRRRIWVIAAAVTAVVAALGGYLLATSSSSPNAWQPVWKDDFNGAAGAAPSPKNWLQDTGTSYPGGAPQWGTGEIQTYTDDRSNARLDGDGHLRITATRDAAGTWHSARLETRRTDFAAAAGGALKVQARIKVPTGGAGYWPAFWMLGADFRGTYTNWPGVGEIDIMENKGSEPSTVHGTFHCGVTPGGPCNENNGITGAYRAPSDALSAGYHTFAVEWDRSTKPEQIRWYVDGHRYLTVRSTDVDAATWAKATHHGYFVLLNLAIGGSFSGPINSATRPGGVMSVDSVSVSRRGA